MENEGSAIGELIIMVGFWSVLAYPVLQFFAVKRMRGFWRVLAFLPLILMAFVFVVTIIGFYQESNLWPIFLIFVSPLVLVYLVVLLVSHAFFVRSKNEEQKQT